MAAVCTLPRFGFAAAAAAVVAGMRLGSAFLTRASRPLASLVPIRAALQVPVAAPASVRVASADSVVAVPEEVPYVAVYVPTSAVKRAYSRPLMVSVR